MTWHQTNDAGLYWDPDGTFDDAARHREAVDEQLGDERPNQDDEAESDDD